MPTVLIVDDSAVVRKVARRIFEMLGLGVSEAEDGETALGLCAEAVPDLVLLDAGLPKMDGHGVLRALREMSGGRHAKVLFAVTENDVGVIARALRGGADAYVMKPFDRDLLSAALRQVGLAREAA